MPNRHRLLWSLMASLSVLVNATWASGLPTQQVLRIQPDGTWVLIRQFPNQVCEMQTYQYSVDVPRVVEKEVQKEVVVDGEKRLVTEKIAVTVMATETKQATRTICKFVPSIVDMPVIEPQKVKAFETDGSPIDPADVVERCTGDTLVVVSADEEMVPDYYAAIFQPGTIILALPKLTAPAPVVMPPVEEGAPAPAPPGFAVPQPAPPPPGTSTFLPLAPLHLVSQVVAPQVLQPQVHREVLPRALEPQLVFVSREGADYVKVRQFEEVDIEVEVTVKVNDSSISPEKTQKVPQTARQSHTTLVPWNALRFGQLQDGNMPLQLVKERLGQGEVTGVMSRDGALIDPFWLQNVKSSVLVLRGVKLPFVTSISPMLCAPAPAPVDTAPRPAPPNAPAPVEQTPKPLRPQA